VELEANAAGKRHSFHKSLKVAPITLSSDSSPAARRLSLTASRKPLRSSPLVGPSISPLVINDDADYDNKSQSDTQLAKPEVIVLPQLPPKTVVSRPKSPDCIMDAPGRRVSIAWDTSVPNPGLERLRRPERHKLKRPRSALSSPTDAYNFPRPQDFLAPMADEKFYYCSTLPTLSPRRPHSFYIDPTAIRSDTSHFPETVSKSPSRSSTDNSWYLASPYDVTPRFTRLGIANVILPVSAKAHSRSKPSVVHLHPSPSSDTLKPRSTILNKFIRTAGSTPSNPVAHLSSSTLSSTVELESDAGPPTTPSPTSSTGLPTPSFASRDVSSHTSDQGGRRKFSLSRMPKNSLARFKSLRFSEKKISDSSHEAFEVRLQVNPDKPNELNLEELVVQSERQPASKPEPLSRGGTIRRIWKSLTAGSKNRL
jgi:hypothetical protein